MIKFSWKLATIVLLTLVISIAGLGLAVAKGPGSGGGGGGGKPGGETAGNNLSFPVIWAEGVDQNAARYTGHGHQISKESGGTSGGPTASTPTSPRPVARRIPMRVTLISTLMVLHYATMEFLGLSI